MYFLVQPLCHNILMYTHSISPSSLYTFYFKNIKTPTTWNKNELLDAHIIVSTKSITTLTLNSTEASLWLWCHTTYSLFCQQNTGSKKLDPKIDYTKNNRSLVNSKKKTQFHNHWYSIKHKKNYIKVERQCTEQSWIKTSTNHIWKSNVQWNNYRPWILLLPWMTSDKRLAPMTLPFIDLLW